MHCNTWERYNRGFQFSDTIAPRLGRRTDYYQYQCHLKRTELSDVQGFSSVVYPKRMLVD